MICRRLYKIIVVMVLFIKKRVGMMEYWNSGRKAIMSPSQHSSIPAFHFPFTPNLSPKLCPSYVR